MVTKITLFLTILFLSAVNASAEDITTIEATNSDISENLDLEGVATLFGESKDLEEFEKKLNDPKTKASNLDLNEDGKVDYLRVLEKAQGKTHLITIQAVIAKDQYQDVATIDVEKDHSGQIQVQVVGDVYMYGPNYVITPVYTRPPIIFTVFYTAAIYQAWHSPYYWGFYPTFFRPWRPFPVYGYHSHVNVNINIRNNSFNHTNIRNSQTAVNLQNKNFGNDFANKHPDKSFSNRNKGVSNKRALNQKTNNGNKARLSNNKMSGGRDVQQNWKSQSQRQGNAAKIKNNKISFPSNSRYKSASSRDHALRGAGNGQQSTRNFNRGASSQRMSGSRSLSGAGLRGRSRR